MNQLTPEIWERVEALFHQALDLPAPRRAAFLDRHCAGDAGLRAEVESLLVGVDTGVPALEAGIGVSRESTVPSAPRELEPGTLLGAYRVLELIGRGGMGEVYLAERADGQFEQRVAAKVLRAEAAEHLDRFQAERQILARLEHPAIARLLDSGLTADHRPYMLMEFVPGEPLAEHARRRRLPLRARLELFLQVCEAVSFAHANLVVHRDLKAGNVLVTAEGRAKLLDFGVAKLIDPALWPSGDNATRAAPLTPDHAAPEQLLGKPITTATDVYALGVVLYDLLVGRSPWAPLRHLPVSVALNRMLRDDPPLPSLAAAELSGAGAARTLRGDLDAIVMRALRKDPVLRYPTVAALQADLRAHLAGLPISARADRTAYVLWKFVRRNRIAVAAAATFLVVLGGFTWRLAVARDRAVLAEAQARNEAEAARQVSDYVVSMFDSASPEQTGGKALSPRELVDRGRDQLQGRLTAPAVRARMLATVGRLYVELGLLPDATASLQQALELQTADPMADPVQTAQYHFDLGEAELLRRELVRAERHFREALALREGHLPADDLRIAQSLLGLGEAQQTSGRIDVAMGTLERAKSAFEATQDGPDHKEYGRLLHLYALAMHTAKRWEEALAVFARAVDVLRRTTGDRHPDFLRAIADYGTVMVRQGHAREAEPLLRKAVANAKSVYGSESFLVQDYESRLAENLNVLGRPREAVELGRRIVAVTRRVAGPDTVTLATEMTNLATDLEEIGAYTEALALVRESLGIQLRGGLETTDSFAARLTQARLLVHLRRTREAREVLTAAMPPDVVGNVGDGYRGARLMNLADCARLDGEFAAAAALYDEAEGFLAPSQPPGDMIFAQLARKRGLLKLAQGDAPAALSFLRSARDRIKALRGPAAPRTLLVTLELAEALAASRATAEAGRLLAQIGPLIARELVPESDAHVRLRALRTRVAEQ